MRAADQEFIRLTNWEKYQSYKDGRNIRWVKLYLNIMDSFAYSEWTDSVKFLALTLILLAGKTDNCIPLNTRWIRQKGSIRSKRIHIEPLIDAGFIEVFVPESYEILPREDKKRIEREGEPTPTPKVFSITPPMKKWAEPLGFSSAALYSETERFLDYHRANGSRKKDWFAAWRMWIHRAKQFRDEKEEIDDQPF